jgi:hypothetical protein
MQPYFKLDKDMYNVKVLQYQIDLKLRKITREEYNALMNKHYEEELQKIGLNLGL